MGTLFTKIMNGEIPSEMVYEDEVCVAFKDIHPKAPVHLLVVPRKEVVSVMELKEGDGEMVGHLIFVAKGLAEELGLVGYKLLFNVGERGGQEVPHLHLHLMGWRE